MPGDHEIYQLTPNFSIEADKKYCYNFLNCLYKSKDFHRWNILLYVNVYYVSWQSFLFLFNISSLYVNKIEKYF